MKNISATEAARQLSALLDAVENRGESFVVMRHGKPIARVEPATAHSGRSAKELLRRAQPDSEWSDDVARTRSLLAIEARPWRD